MKTKIAHLHRIGNLFKDQQGNLLKVDMLDAENDNVWFYVIDRSKLPLPKGWKCQQIELTDEILLKCNFENDGLLYRLEGEKFVFRSDCKYLWVYNKDTSGCITMDCQHLDKLQNVYFLLEDTELPINIEKL